MLDSDSNQPTSIQPAQQTPDPALHSDFDSISLIAPRPTNLEQTGLSQTLLLELLLKHLMIG